MCQRIKIKFYSFTCVPVCLRESVCASAKFAVSFSFLVLFVCFWAIKSVLINKRFDCARRRVRWEGAWLVHLLIRLSCARISFLFFLLVFTFVYILISDPNTKSCSNFRHLAPKKFNQTKRWCWLVFFVLLFISFYSKFKWCGLWRVLAGASKKFSTFVIVQRREQKNRGKDWMIETALELRL